MGDMILFSSAAGATPCLKEAYDQSCVMDEALGLLAQALRQIEAGEDVLGAFQRLTSTLLHLLRLADRSPCIEGTLDHLHEVARRLVADIKVDGVASPGRCQDLHAAYLTFRGQLSTARPHGSARTFGPEEQQHSTTGALSPQQGALTSLSGTLQGSGPDQWPRVSPS